MVREKLPRISLGTVYRNLDLLTTSGEILRLDKAGTQKRFDGNPMPHMHVRCRSCGRIGDVFGSEPLPPVNGISARDFTVQEVEVEYVGLCRDCEAKEPFRDQ
jgi:Fur family ferric uptake transcriptional regulator